MAGEINRFPEGLLAVLDLKTRGNTPSGLGDQVTPGLDMLPYYELNRGWSVAQASSNAVGGSYTPTIQVPNAEVWLVRAVSVRCECIAVGSWWGTLTAGPSNSLNAGMTVGPNGGRSEERRVGKEC